MAFTTWAALRTAIKDSIADYVANGGSCTGSYSIAGRTLNYRSINELEELLNLCDRMENRETAGTPSTRVSYGRYRRFK